MKSYISIDHIYVEKLAELCDESSYNYNSYNLLRCEELHEAGWPWKVIYFALLQYRSWYVKQRDNEHLAYSGMCFGNNTYDPCGEILDDFIRLSAAKVEENMVAEEFFFKNMRV